MRDIQPTARWANRMLRPLTSIFRRLEKHQENLSIIASSQVARVAEACDADPIPPLKTLSTEDCSPYSDDDGEDPAWLPGKLINRRVKHRYSTRMEGIAGRRRTRASIRSPELRKTLLPGAIEIATPLITGKPREPLGISSRKQQLKAYDSYDVVCAANIGQKWPRTSNTRTPAYQGSWKEAVEMSTDSEFIAIVHLLDRIFLKFLDNTRAPASSLEQTRGARSLLSMAVRRFPDFIEDEQDIQDKVDNDINVDMCDTYLYELEVHYAPGGGGWQPLREVVRVQGIYLVSEMVRRRWITKHAACKLLDECINHHEFDTFEVLTSKYLSTIDSYGYPTAFDQPGPSDYYDDPVYILGTYFTRSNSRRSFVFDQMADLLLRRVVAPEWMVTTLWKRCIDCAISSLSAEDSHSAAAKRLIEAVVLTASSTYPPKDTATVRTKHFAPSHTLRQRRGRVSATSIPTDSEDNMPCPIPIQDALSNLISSLIAALCGMHVARSCSSTLKDQAVGSKINGFVQSLAFMVAREVEISPAPNCTSIPTCRLLRQGYTLLGQFLVQHDGSDSDIICWLGSGSRENTEVLLSTLSSRQGTVKELSMLVLQVFHCYERVHSPDQTRTSEEIRRKVFQLLHPSHSRGLSTFLGNIATETAMALAETTGDPDDHIWATEVQEVAASLQHGNSTRHAKIHGCTGDRSGLFQWEEGIGEWVASTPPVWKVKAVEIIMKRVNVTPKLQSRTPCSMTSRSSTSSVEDSTSSATSSVPPSSAKRRRDNSKWRSSKKRCSVPTEEYSSGESESFYSAKSPINHQARGQTIAASKHIPRERENIIRARAVPRRGGQPVLGVDLITVSQKGSKASNTAIRQSSTTSKHGRSTRSTATSPPTARAEYAKIRITGGPSLASRVLPAISYIRDNESDGSDDELSFL